MARLGDGWLASAYNTSPEAFAEGRRRLAQERARLDRTDLPAAVATMWTWVTDDPVGALRRGDQAVITALARIELGASGLQPPRGVRA